MKWTSAAPLAALLFLAGCGGDKPDPPSSSTSTNAATSTTSTSPSPTTTSASPTTGATTDPNIPAAARAHTPAGAEAFVRYFYSQLNLAWTTPRAGLLSALSAPGCMSCAELEATAAELVQKRQHYDGAPVTIVSVGGLGQASLEHPQVLVVFIQERRSVIDASGHVALTDPRKQGKFVATLGWSSRGWSVATVKSLA